jgi:hypothetical protein
VSSAITVPADAEKVLCDVSGHHGIANGLATVTFTKGAADTAMTKVGGDTDPDPWQGDLFWLDAPDTGTNKSLKWDWIGTGVSEQERFLFSAVPTVFVIATSTRV